MWAFTQWYDKNKKTFNEKRKERYRTDPAYRERIVLQARQRRLAAKPDCQKTGLSVEETCALMSVSKGTLSRWCSNGYIPLPSLRGYQFSTAQIDLLGLIKSFFETHPKKLSDAQKSKLSDIVSVIHHNWN